MISILNLIALLSKLLGETKPVNELTSILIKFVDAPQLHRRFTYTKVLSNEEIHYILESLLDEHEGLVIDEPIEIRIENDGDKDKFDYVLGSYT